ncbi:MAG: TonB-dependent receptor, partial [Gammaproteobacteria bacterium]
VVTGTFIRRTQGELASPIQVLSVDDMADIGITSVPDIVNTLTVNTGALIYANNLDQGRNAGTTNINLRGLGESSTLVLLNGTRNTLTPAVNGAGDQYVNLSTLVPRIALQRVEILKDGASALYGSDAVAGVVNLITRDDFEGFEFNVEYSNNDHGANQADLGLIFGGRHDRGNFMAAFNYLTIDPVITADRSADYQSHRNSITGFGMPSTIVSFGENTIIADPQCSNVGNQMPPGLVFKAYLCRLTFGNYGHIVPDEKRAQAYVSGTYEFSDRTEFFGEMSWATNEVIIGSVPTQPVTNPVYVPEDHPDLAIFAPGNPDPYSNVKRKNADGNREVQWWGRPLGAGTPQNNDMKPFGAWRLRSGLRGEVNDWSYELSWAYSNNETAAFRHESILNELQQALYGRGGPNRDEWFRFAWDSRDLNSQGLMDQMIGLYGYESKSTQRVVDAVISGQLGDMAGGPIGAAFGVQFRQDKLEYDFNDQSEQFVFSFFIGGADFKAEQESSAVFAELAFPMSDNFELNLAARAEKIDAESTMDPKLSFLWTPTDALSVRGSVGTSFRMPSLFSKGGTFFDASAGTDPVSGQAITYRGEFAVDSKNPVVPQEATTFNLGATYTNAGGLTTSVDYWSFDYDGFITYENHGAILVTDPTGPQVHRDASGNVIAITGYARNAGFIKTDGVDFSLRYAIDTNNGGTVTPFFESTFMLSYDIDDPTWGPMDALGGGNTYNIGAPAIEERANLGVQWAKGNHAANIIARYIGPYDNDEMSSRLGGAIVDADGKLDPANYLPVESMTSIDAQYSYQLDDLFSSGTSSTVRLGVRNASNEIAPLMYGTAGYDERVHDPRGRYVYMSLRTAF